MQCKTCAGPVNIARRDEDIPAKEANVIAPVSLPRKVNVMVQCQLSLRAHKHTLLDSSGTPCFGHHDVPNVGSAIRAGAWVPAGKTWHTQCTCTFTCRWLLNTLMCKSKINGAKMFAGIRVNDWFFLPHWTVPENSTVDFTIFGSYYMYDLHCRGQVTAFVWPPPWSFCSSRFLWCICVLQLTHSLLGCSSSLFSKWKVEVLRRSRAARVFLKGLWSRCFHRVSRLLHPAAGHNWFLVEVSSGESLVETCFLIASFKINCSRGWAWMENMYRYCVKNAVWSVEFRVVDVGLARNFKCKLSMLPTYLHVCTCTLYFSSVVFNKARGHNNNYGYVDTKDMFTKMLEWHHSRFGHANVVSLIDASEALVYRNVPSQGSGTAITCVLHVCTLAWKPIDLNEMFAADPTHDMRWT